MGSALVLGTDVPNMTLVNTLGVPRRPKLLVAVTITLMNLPISAGNNL